LVEILRAAFLGPGSGTPSRAMAKALIAQAGSQPPSRLSSAHIIEINAQLRTNSYAASTRWNYSKALRQILRWLWEHHGAPKLDDSVRKYPKPRPRNITARPDEIATILAAAPDHMRLWLLFCSDLAIRSGTAIRLGPAHYNRQRGTLSFTTKCDEHLTLPVTAEIESLIRLCNLNNPESFVHQLWRAYHATPRRGGQLRTLTTNGLRDRFAHLRKQLDLRRITPHDLRRTTAVNMLEHSRDIRDVQGLLGHKDLNSTVWYLDHALRPIQRNTLELIKRPHPAQEEKTA
jgi:integrase